MKLNTYYAVIEMRGGKPVGEPVPPLKAKEQNPKAWKHLVWTVQALEDEDAARIAGQLDMFSGRPKDADVAP